MENALKNNSIKISIRKAFTKEEIEQLQPGDQVVLRDIPYGQRDGLTVGEQYKVLDTYNTRTMGKGVVIKDDNNQRQELHSGFFARPADNRQV